MGEKNDTRPAVIVVDPDTLAELIDSAVERALERRGVSADTAIAPEWLDANGAAEILGVTARTVQNLATRGELRGARVGHLWRFRRSDVLAMLEPDAA